MNARILSQTKWVLLTSVFTLISQSQAFAEGGLHLRSLISMGPGSTTFSQSDNSGHSTEVSSNTSIGMNVQFGLGFSRFFGEYNAYWLLPGYTPPLREQDAGYLSLMGVNAGVSLDPIPVEVYAGLEKAGYSLHGVEGADFSGITTKLGVAAYLLGGSPGSFKVGGRVEFRRMTIGSDDSGSLPASVSSHTNVVWMGVTIGAG